MLHNRFNRRNDDLCERAARGPAIDGRRGWRPSGRELRHGRNCGWVGHFWSVHSGNMQVISPEQLKKAVPRCPNPDTWAVALNNAMLVYGIADSPKNMAEFLAQTAHESDGFNRLEEQLSYTAERLCEVWPARFPSVTVSAAYARAPHKLADLVYSNRMGNGDVESGDGWQYRGRGILMITGRANYQRVATLTNDKALMTCPDRLLVKNTACNAAAAWWQASPELKQLSIVDDVVSVSQIINGGAQGLAQRRQLVAAFSDQLSVA